MSFWGEKHSQNRNIAWFHCHFHCQWIWNEAQTQLFCVFCGCSNVHIANFSISHSISPQVAIKNQIHFKSRHIMHLIMHNSVRTTVKRITKGIDIDDSYWIWIPEERTMWITIIMVLIKTDRKTVKAWFMEKCNDCNL